MHFIYTLPVISTTDIHLFPVPRCIVQLSLLGYILVPIFRVNTWWLVLAYALFMLCVAAAEAVARPAYTYKVGSKHPISGVISSIIVRLALSHCFRKFPKTWCCSPERVRVDPSRVLWGAGVFSAGCWMCRMAMTWRAWLRAGMRACRGVAEVVGPRSHPAGARGRSPHEGAVAYPAPNKMHSMRHQKNPAE